MKKSLGVLLVVLFAFSPALLAKEKTLDELIKEAESSNIDKQPDRYMDVAEREMKLLEDSMKSSSWEDFRKQMDAVVNYCDKAQSAAIASNKKVKKTEIRIRRISEHLRNDKLNVDVDDIDKVQAAVDKLEHFRTELLQKMFGVTHD